MEIITLNTTNSTNSYAKENIDSLADKTVIRAINQTDGRGRFSRKWIDLGNENLFLTFVLKPSNFFEQKFANLTQYLSVILAKTIEKYKVATQIKWPNDVLVNNKKIAGILCETIMQGNNFKGLALGIGINLNAEQIDLDKIQDKIATALNIEIKQKVDSEKFLQELVKSFFDEYNNFLEHGFSYIKNDYIKRLSILGKEISVQILNETKTGIAKDINDFGELVLIQNGTEHTLNIGDIL